MAIRIDAIEAVQRVELPALILREKRQIVALELEASANLEEHCEIHVVGAEQGLVNIVRATLPSRDILLITTGPRIPAPTRDAAFHLHATDFRSVDRTLKCIGQVRWLKHPNGLQPDFAVSALAAPRSWHSNLNLKPQVVNTEGEITRSGLRTPQIGALHALAAHWTIDIGVRALVVLPTGTGKTEVMIAATVMSASKRLLVLVPSDALRRQTAEKFRSFGILPKIRTLADDCKRPVVATLIRAPTSATERAELILANVVISTVAMIQTLTDENLACLIDQFDSVFFDEAHHIPAASWKRVYEKLEKRRVVGFTATPFRLDGGRVPGKLIYQFPLRLAQEQGYFQKINFICVDESETAAADRLIALRAIEQLRADLAVGRQHLLLARAATKARADSLYTDIYSILAPDLSPVVIYSGIKGKGALARAIREGQHPIVICVDMFGEGFDLPALKIAAMHDIHRSLAITLQFVGRFTRTDARYGAATLVANVSDGRVQEAIEDLYAEDADWNGLIPELSAQANLAHLELGEFVEQMRSLGPDHGAFDLTMLRPKTSTVIYRIDRFSATRYRQGLRPSTKVHRAWISQDRNTCILITRSDVKIDWAHVKEVTDEIWDLTVLAHDPDRGLLFINSSQTKSLYGSLARAVAGNSASLLKGEPMFRALSGFNRLVFHNVGLYGRGKLRFKMFTGYDVSEAISPTTQAGAMKSNIFGVGYENGKRGSIGVSFKGRLWQMSSSTVPEWRKWCDAVAGKVLNSQLPTDGFLAHTLIPKELSALPDTRVVSVLPPDEWIAEPDTIRVVAGMETHDLLSVGVTDWQQLDNHRLIISMSFGTNLTVAFELEWAADRFEVRQMDGARVTLTNEDCSLADYLAENPPVLLLADGSEIRGSLMLSPREQLIRLFDPNQIRVLNWEGVPITVESKWHNGQRRDASVQGRLIEELTDADNSFVIDDDDSGEAADVVEIVQGQHEIIFRLYHCKFSGSADPGVRMNDLYIVSGQAIRSSRIATSPVTLLSHLEKRETERRRGGRPTRFEKGTIADLRKLRRKIDRFQCRYEIWIVQPGLSRAQLTPEAATVLAAADTYVREFTATPLRIYASE